jgi:hypothetical protein
MSCCGCTCKRGRGDREPVLCCKAKWQDEHDRFSRCTGCECCGSRAEPGGFNVKLKGPADTARELGKYCAKELGEAQPNLPLGDLCEFLQATWGRRMLTTFGTHYNPQLEAEEEELDLRAFREVVDGKHRCPVCSGDDLFLEGVQAVERSPPEKEACVTTTR